MSTNDAPVRPVPETFLREETHSFPLDRESRLVLDSDGRGWKSLYASLSSRRRWTGRHPSLDDVCLAYCLRQTAVIERRIEGEPTSTVFILRPRQFGFIPRQVATDYRLTGSADMLMVHLKSELVERTARKLFGEASPGFLVHRRVGISDPLLEQLVLEIVAALGRTPDPQDAAYGDSIAEMMAAHILRHHTNRLPAEAAPAQALPVSLVAGLCRVREFIENHLDEGLKLDRLASEAGIGTQAFTTAFVKAYKETPHQYVINRRVEQARRLLCDTNLSISEIALMTGFASQSHLSDVFKRIVGETPRAYRVSRSP